MSRHWARGGSRRRSAAPANASVQRQKIRQSTRRWGLIRLTSASSSHRLGRAAAGRGAACAGGPRFRRPCAARLSAGAGLGDFPNACKPNAGFPSLCHFCPFHSVSARSGCPLLHGAFTASALLTVAIWRRSGNPPPTARRLKGSRRIFSCFELLDVMFVGFIGFALIAAGLRLLQRP